MIRWLAAAALVVAMPASAQMKRAELVTKLEAMAKADNAEALYHLGMMRHLGMVGPKDAPGALALFRRAAEAGDPLGAYKYGCYFDGQGEGLVEPDPVAALKWKLIAAEAGYSLAQHDVAGLYFKSGDKDAALEWLTRAAQQGYTPSLAALASLYNSDTVGKDAARTYAYSTLYLRRLSEPTERQKSWLADFAAKMSADDKARGDRIIADWAVAPTELTQKALSGLRAAEALAGTAE